jgi:para-nitrobenzyl esterase
LRWKAPRREATWDGVRDATKFSAICAQGDFAMEALMGGTAPQKSEDGLYLNVYTPGCDDARRPVMVWIHGGAFIFGHGSTPWYDGTQFALNGDVVIVTINYRLAAFGYLHLADLFGPEFEGSGNAGVLDQAAALEWVRDCIANFGGDPDNVTIFGESAGGGSVGTLLGLPATKGLFHGAIAQSGASSWYTSREGGTKVAQAIIDALGVKAGDVEALRNVSMDALINVATGIGLSVGSGTLPFQPVVDGTVLPAPMLDTIAAGNTKGVRVMTGTNLHEMTLFNLMDPSLATIDQPGICNLLRPRFGDAADALVADYATRRPNATGIELWTAVATDGVFRIPAIRLAEAHSTHSPAWMYLFTWESPAFGGALRSTHALEIVFVFDNLAQPGADMLTGTGAERQDIADAMHRAWIAFARNGNPEHDGIPAWPAYDTTRRPTMRFDTTREILSDPYGEDRAAWDDVTLITR